MPFLIPVEDAATIIRGGLARNQARIAFPFGTAAAVWFVGLLLASRAARLLDLTAR